MSSWPDHASRWRAPSPEFGPACPSPVLAHYRIHIVRIRWTAVEPKNSLGHEYEGQRLGLSVSLRDRSEICRRFRRGMNYIDTGAFTKSTHPKCVRVPYTSRRSMIKTNVRVHLDGKGGWYTEQRRKAASGITVSPSVTATKSKFDLGNEQPIHIDGAVKHPE